MNLEDVIRVFHEPDCPGIITSRQSGPVDTEFVCAECGERVGTVNTAVFQQFTEVLERLTTGC